MICLDIRQLCKFKWLQRVCWRRYIAQVSIYLCVRNRGDILKLPSLLSQHWLHPDLLSCRLVAESYPGATAYRSYKNRWSSSQPPHDFPQRPCSDFRNIVCSAVSKAIERSNLANGPTVDFLYQFRDRLNGEVQGCAYYYKVHKRRKSTMKN